ncbi:MAG: DUF3800 domain-containing protein, partial [Planktotalea sp.]|uniref:DUF3800 domain-containing protein n=1 Tax=Planktotalea sp. TaxID=2029877 RepID=UPI003C744817
TTCFAHSLRRINQFCDTRNTSFVTVMDQHSARKELLECAAKTMFGRNPCRRLASPPFEVESYLNQNIQAADWIATIVGRLKAYEIAPIEYRDYEHINTLFSDRIRDLSRFSILEKRPQTQKRPRPTGPFESLADFRDSLNS